MDQVGVVHRGRSSRLRSEKLERCRLVREFLREELDGDGATQVLVDGEVDHAHPPSADLPLELVTLVAKGVGTG